MDRIEREDGFVARSATPADLPGMARVIEAAFPRWPPVETDASALEHLQWKTSAPGASFRSHSVVEFDGQIVAVKLRWLGRALLDGHEYITDTGADFAVAPAFQGRGLGRLLNDFEDRADRPHGSISFEATPHDTAVMHMHIDGAIHPARVWLRPLRLRTFLGAHLRGSRPTSILRATADGLAARIPPRRGQNAGVASVEEFDRFDQRIDALWLETRDRFDFIRFRDAEHMNWRYADPRAGRHRLLGRFDGARALAYAVFRPVAGMLQLSDALIHPAHSDAGVEVLRRGAALGRELGRAGIVAWLPPDHPDEPAFAAAGFVASRAPMPIEFKPPRGARLPDIEARFARGDLRRHVTIGDFDFA